MPRIEDLSKEQKKALSVFSKNCPNFSKLVNKVSLQKDSPLLPTGFITISSIPIKIADLPRDNYWSWNQSNGRTIVNIVDANITIRKVTSRIRTSFDTAKSSPSFKIWIFDVKYKSKMPIYFLWCEKGGLESPEEKAIIEYPGVVTAIGTIHPEAISLQSLSFLKCFTDIDVAEELGWV